jgi:hypothetical protein
MRTKGSKVKGKRAAKIQDLPAKKLSKGTDTAVKGGALATRAGGEVISAN